VARSRGEWIAFLDDDDEWLPTKLQGQLETLRANASAVACSCSYIMRLSSGASKVVIVPTDVTLRQLPLDNRLGSASLCLSSSSGVLREIGGFDVKFRSAQDMDLWVRLRQKGAAVASRGALVLYRVHQGLPISNNMQSQYVGQRRFYFKHRDLMDAPLRRHRISHNCFIMSCQTTRRLRPRFRYLILSLLNSSPAVSLAYAKSSAETGQGRASEGIDSTDISPT
jgi:glycosyl transferase family 2